MVDRFLPEESIENYVSDLDIVDWEAENKEFLLYVCSECGLICSKTINHGDCGLQDWWHLDVKCFRRREKNE